MKYITRLRGKNVGRNRKVEMKKNVDAIPENWQNNTEQKTDIAYLFPGFDLKKIFFELTPLRSVLRCTLLLSVVGTYNSGYEVRPSARGLLKLLPTVATSHIRGRYSQKGGGRHSQSWLVNV